MAEPFGWSHGALLCGPDAGETPAVPEGGLPKRLLPGPPRGLTKDSIMISAYLY